VGVFVPAAAITLGRRMLNASVGFVLLIDAAHAPVTSTTGADVSGELIVLRRGSNAASVSPSPTVSITSTRASSASISVRRCDRITDAIDDASGDREKHRTPRSWFGCSIWIMTRSFGALVQSIRTVATLSTRKCSAGRLRRPVRLLVDRFRVVLGTLDVGVLVDAAGDVRIVGVECVVPTGSPVSGVVEWLFVSGESLVRS